LFFVIFYKTDVLFFCYSSGIALQDLWSVCGFVFATRPHQSPPLSFIFIYCCCLFFTDCLVTL